MVTAVAKDTRPELIQLLERRTRGFEPGREPKGDILVKEDKSVKSIDPDAATTLTFLNPRESFVSVDALAKEIAQSGQLEPVDLYTLTGEALAYANDERPTDMPEITEKTLIVGRGERRTRAMRRNKKEFAELRPSESNPFASMKYRNRGVIHTRIQLVETYNDQALREGLTTRFEMAKAMKQFRDAGVTLSVIGEKFGVTAATVNNYLRIFDLPNNEAQGFLIDQVRNFDLTKDKFKRGVVKREELDALVAFSDSGIRKLEKAFRWKYGANAGKTWIGDKRDKEAPVDFDEFWATVQARKDTDEPAKAGERTWNEADIRKVLGLVGQRFREDVKPVAITVLQALLENQPKLLETYFAAASEAPAS